MSEKQPEKWTSFLLVFLDFRLVNVYPQAYEHSESSFVSLYQIGFLFAADRKIMLLHCQLARLSPVLIRYSLLQSYFTDVQNIMIPNLFYFHVDADSHSQNLEDITEMLRFISFSLE